MEQLKKNILTYINRIPSIEENVKVKNSFYRRYTVYTTKLSGLTMRKMLLFLREDVVKFLERSYGQKKLKP